MAASRATAPPSLSDGDPYKRAAAERAASLVPDGACVGLGTGSTVAFLLSALAARGLRLRCVATSPATESAAHELGLRLYELDDLGELDIAIDGADQVDPHGWLVKGGGGAHAREKIVARASKRFVAIVSADKLVAALRPPVPLEVMAFGCRGTLASIGEAQLREGAPPSPDGNLIADYLGPIGDPRELAARLSATPGVVEHGLFAPEMVGDVIVAGPDGVEHRVLHAPSPGRSRSHSHGQSRGPAPGQSRSPAPGQSRSPAPGQSRAPSPGQGVPPAPSSGSAG